MRKPRSRTKKPALTIAPFRYTTGAPAGYACQVCGKVGVKLWRESHTAFDEVTLHCATCAAARQPGGSEVGEDGKWTAPGDDYQSDQVGGLVPAVPTEDGATFWGYTSVTRPACSWWDSLPTHLPSGAVVATCPHGATPDLGAWITVASFDLAHSLCAPRPPTVPDDAGQDCHTVHDPGCYARTYDRATGGWTRCRLPAGHDGDHSDGCLQWTTVADFWASVAASG